MNDARRRSEGGPSDRRWFHDQRVLTTALVATAPFIFTLLWQVFALGGEWALLESRVTSVEGDFTAMEIARAPLVERFIGVENDVTALKATLIRLEDKVDRIVERVGAERRPVGDAP